MDWVDIRPDPHWTSYALVPLVLGFAIYKLPSGFLPLFLVLCACAAVACLVAVIVIAIGAVVWGAVSDVTLSRLANYREGLRESIISGDPVRPRI